MKLMKLKPVDIRVGDYIYIGHRGKKKWRVISKIDVISAYSYTLTMPEWGVCTGSDCEYLVKGFRNNNF